MTPCESCSMPIETGPYCQYCIDEEGNLQDFETRLTKMMAWAKGQNPEVSDQDLRTQTMAHMKTMPAWKDHPKLAGV